MQYTSSQKSFPIAQQEFAYVIAWVGFKKIADRNFNNICRLVHEKLMRQETKMVITIIITIMWVILTQSCIAIMKH